MKYDCNDTQLRIAEGFKALVMATSNPRKTVSVTKIVDTVGVDRKTFYNYFDNTADLVVWIFRHGVAEMLQDDEFQLAELDYPARSSRDKYSAMACYARLRNSDGMLNQRRFFRSLCMLFEQDKFYYQRVFSRSCYIDLYNYIIHLYMPLIKKDIQIIAGEDRKLPEVPLNFLAEYHTIGLFGRVKYHFSLTKQDMSQAELYPFWNYAHEVIRITLDAMFEEEASDVDKTRAFFKMASNTRQIYTNRFS